MRILLQVQRGIKSLGFWAGLILLLFTLQFVHMDSSLYWRRPLAYFSSGDFFYTFIISIYVGLVRFVFPLCAILPSGMMFVEEKESRFLVPILHRQTPRGYVADRMTVAALTAVLMVFLAIAVTTTFYLMVCPIDYQEDSFQKAAIASAYSWRADPEYFWVFVIEAAGRLALSAVFWTWMAIAFSGIWSNKVFVTVATLVFAYALESIQLKMGLKEWTVSFIQAPDVYTTTPLWVPLLKQTGYTMAAAAFCWISLRSAISSRIQRRVHSLCAVATSFVHRIIPEQKLFIPRKIMGKPAGQLWADLRAFFTPSTILCASIVSILCALLSNAAYAA